jgi:dephospho-CoA kinase
MTYHVGLTGNIAAGKSSVTRLFAEWGATVIDADAIVRELQRPGTPVFAAIVARFGPEIVDATGHLDRAALRRIVFHDPEARAALDRIVHPAVAAERQRRLEAARAARTPIVVEDIPLLFEVMDPSHFDAVVLVDAPEAVRQERLMRDRGLDADTARAMIQAQMAAAAKRAGSRYLIDNTGDREALHRAARAVWDALAEEAGRRA